MAALTDMLMRRNKEVEDDAQLICELRELSEKLGYAYERFEMQCDSDLVDASIYEIEALKARYRYLLGIAREKKLKATK